MSISQDYFSDTSDRIHKMKDSAYPKASVLTMWKLNSFCSKEREKSMQTNICPITFPPEKFYYHHCPEVQNETNPPIWYIFYISHVRGKNQCTERP